MVWQCKWTVPSSSCANWEQVFVLLDFFFHLSFFCLLLLPVYSFFFSPKCCFYFQHHASRASFPPVVKLQTGQDGERPNECWTDGINYSQRSATLSWVLQLSTTMRPISTGYLSSALASNSPFYCCKVWHSEPLELFVYCFSNVFHFSKPQHQWKEIYPLARLLTWC